jgi:hypothetical protein
MRIELYAGGLLCYLYHQFNQLNPATLKPGEMIFATRGVAEP